MCCKTVHNILFKILMQKHLWNFKIITKLSTLQNSAIHLYLQQLCTFSILCGQKYSVVLGAFISSCLATHDVFPHWKYSNINFWGSERSEAIETNIFQAMRRRETTSSSVNTVNFISMTRHSTDTLSLQHAISTTRYFFDMPLSPVTASMARNTFIVV